MQTASNSPAQNAHMRHWGRGHGYGLGLDRAKEVGRNEPNYEDLLWFADASYGTSWVQADVDAFRGGMADGKGEAS